MKIKRTSRIGEWVLEVKPMKGEEYLLGGGSGQPAL
jgi:hypothetical protein